MNNAQALSILRYEESGYRVEDIEAFIRDLEKDFVPPLGTRTDLKTYAEKLTREAVVGMVREQQVQGHAAKLAETLRVGADDHSRRGGM